MYTKASDFRIFWDDAYTVHHLTEKADQLKNIFAACKSAGNPHRVFMYSSSSKITFPGSGIAMMAASEENQIFLGSSFPSKRSGPIRLTNFDMFVS